MARVSRCGAVDFTGIARSTEISDGNRVLRFPTLSDYVAFVISKQLIAQQSELYEHSDLVLDIQKHWHSQGQTACKFAQILARSDQREWHHRIINGSFGNATGKRAEEVVSAVEETLHSSDVEALSIVLPRLTSPTDLTELLRRLDDLPGWRVQTTASMGLGGIGYVDVAVRVALSKFVDSWVLGLGPFNFLPRTRQSPFTELMVRTKPQKAPYTRSDLRADPTAAHLADLPVDVTPHTFRSLWSVSKRLRETMMRNDVAPAARARVTFSIPLVYWQAQDATIST